MIPRSSTQCLEPPTCEDGLILDVVLSATNTSTLLYADEIGLFSLLAAAPLSATEVASQLALGERFTRAMLGILTALGLLAQHQGKFRITEPTRNFLLPDSPYYWGGFLELGRQSAAPRHVPRSERPRRFGEGGAIVDEWKRQHPDPEFAGMFTAAMHTSLAAATGIARRGDFSRVRRLLDVGGGSGSHSIALAQRYPEMRCTVLELPVICKLAEEYIARYGMQDRIDTYPADMFGDLWPPGHDAIYFGAVFHDWDRDGCLQLARRSHQALPSGGRIYPAEALLNETQDGPLATLCTSMAMALHTEGKQLTAGELDELLRECGFVDVSVMPAYSYTSLVTARKP